MKKTYLFLTKLVFLGTLLTVVSCGEDDPTIDNGQVDVLPSSIQLDEFETDEGEIAVSFSARSIAQKGYTPAIAEIAFNEVEIASMEVPFDEYNNIATVSFKNDELDDNYMQMVTPDNQVYGVPSSQYYPSTSNRAAEVTAVEIDQVDYNSEETRKFSAYLFGKVPGEENLFTITTYDGPDRHNLYMQQNTLMVQTKANIERNGGNRDHHRNQGYR